MTTRWRSTLIVPAVACWMAWALPTRCAFALSAAVDADRDGWLDGLETLLGSSSADAARTPESFAAQPTCLDGVDNDGDGQADLTDPGCTAPTANGDVFPGAGDDVFDSHLVLDGYQFATASLGTCTVDFDAHGPTVVRRSNPTEIGGGRREIRTEMLAMQLGGMATIAAGCGIPAGDYPITVYEDPARTTVGQVTDTNPDASKDFPADSFFDVFFVIDTPAGALPGGPPGGPVGQAVRVTNQVTQLPPYRTAKNPDCYKVAGQTHEHCPKAPPSHHKCYRAKFPRFARREVTLRDQFGDEQAMVLRPLYLCNPSTKGGEPLYDSTAHLACYALKPKKNKQSVVVRNQFQNGQVTTKRSSMLCLPANKNGEGDPLELDHYKCYTGKFPQNSRRDVNLMDQFKTEATNASKALHLCNPVSKNGEGIRNPLEHLVCYAIRPQKERRTVTVADQFGSGAVKIQRSELLCVPSSKTETGSSTTTTTLPKQGRAVILAQQTGGFETGTPVCLDRIGGQGCVAGPDACTSVHLHRPITIDGQGPYGDPNQPVCGHGEVVTGSPGCGPDTVPPCS
jgi:hypothetical protein